MSGNRRFVDTNILVYAHDTSAGDKHERARALLEQLWAARDGCLSVQILQEFFVNVTRKIPRPLGATAARSSCSSWPKRSRLPSLASGVLSRASVMSVGRPAAPLLCVRAALRCVERRSAWQSFDLAP